MSENETIADIVAELRRCPTNTVLGGMVSLLCNRLADRIEAAAKREASTQKSENCVVAKRDEVVLRLSKDEYKGMQEALSEHDRLCEMLSESRKSVGNAAAMREALELAITIYDWCCARTDDPLECCEFSCAYQVEPHGEAGADCPWKKIRATLSAPPRNGDRLSADQCKRIFKSEMEIYLTQDATDRDREIALRTAYGVIDALFAPYTEREGGEE